MLQACYLTVGITRCSISLCCAMDEDGQTTKVGGTAAWSWSTRRVVSAYIAVTTSSSSISGIEVGMATASLTKKVVSSSTSRKPKPIRFSPTVRKNSKVVWNRDGMEHRTMREEVQVFRRADQDLVSRIATSAWREKEKRAFEDARNRISWRISQQRVRWTL